MNSVKKNYIYMVIYYVLTFIIPLITVPYLTRTLGSSSLGIYSYTFSIVNYFMMLTLLGVNNYGNRKVAQIRDDKDLLKKTFWGIYFLQLILGILMVLVYFIYLSFFCIEYKRVSCILTLFIFSSIADINWFFFGLEKFKVTIIRNTILKIINLVLVFVLVKNSDDLIIYSLVMSGMTLISQLAMWSYLFKEITFYLPTLLEIKKHIKPNILLFLPVIAVSLYKVMDKIMLGYLVNDISFVGFYDTTEKIINIPTTLITALGTVMLPRISNMISKKNFKEINLYISKSIDLMMFLSIPCCFGLISMSSKLIPLFLGDNFSECIVLLQYLSITLPIVSFANVIRTQYLIPFGKDKTYIVSSFVGAIINLVLNAILIPKYYAVGACIGTIAAELVVMVYQILKVRNCLPVKKYLFSGFSFAIKGLVMFVAINLVCGNIENAYLNIFIKVVLGIIFYFSLNFKYIKTNLMLYILKK